MKPLSKEAENLILQASVNAADLVNQGLTPNQAIVKVAKETQLPPGHVTLLVHAYNTGRTTRQREVGSDLFEKAADFTLADMTSIAEELYPTQIKSAQRVYEETVVSHEYLIPPTGFIARREDRLQKAASAKRATAMVKVAAAAPPPKELPRDELMVLQKVKMKVASNNRRVEEHRARVSHAMDKAAAAFDELRQHFKQASDMPYGDARQQVSLRIGDAGLKVLDKVVEDNPRLTKQAATDRIYMGRCAASDLTQKVIDTLAAYTHIKTAHELLARGIADANKELLLPFVQSPSSPISLSCFNKEANSFAWGMAGGGVKDVLGGLAKTIQPPTNDKLLQQSMDELTDPHHESQLRNIRTTSVLQDLMANDPVISGYQPEEVLSAVNEIGSLSPRSVDQRLVMQSLLRRRLSQGSLDGMEINQLLDTEDRLKKRDTNAPQHPGAPMAV